jgi:hypothetical protein
MQSNNWHRDHKIPANVSHSEYTKLMVRSQGRRIATASRISRRNGALVVREMRPRWPIHKKQNLIERYGADMRLPELREEIARCERHGKMHDVCMVRYVDLIPKR